MVITNWREFDPKTPGRVISVKWVKTNHFIGLFCLKCDKKPHIHRNVLASQSSKSNRGSTDFILIVVKAKLICRSR